MGISFKAARLLINRGILKVKAASPEIMLGIGIAILVGAAIIRIRCGKKYIII